MQIQKKTEDKEQPLSFDLQSFFPYQTRVFYKHVTGSVSRIYEDSCGMKPYEWRTLAILGNDNSLTAAEIVEKSSMDKVSVSRAVSSLRRRNLILERPNRCDGRSRVLRLSKEGKTVLSQLVPQMLEVERKLLSPLTGEEAAELLRLMQKVRASQPSE